MIYDLTFNKKNLSSSKIWLFQALSALAFAGIFSILLVALRTPGIQEIFPFKNFFHTALVVHVDLSVLVWLLSVGSLVLDSMIKEPLLPYSKVAAKVSFLGTALIFAAGFTPENEPLMNNYVPVLADNLIFFAGLGLFFAGIIMHNLLVFYSGLEKSKLQVFALSYSFIIIMAALTFYATSIKLGSSQYISSLHNFYEMLFWPMGHQMQFAFTQLLLLAWILVLSGCLGKMKRKYVEFILLANTILASFSIYGLIEYNIDDAEFISFFTNHMIIFGGLAPLALIFVILWNFDKLRSLKFKKPENSAFLASFILFIYGGVLGYMIQGVNVVIPAHYHGSIVGITIAAMGLVYYIIPRLGYNEFNSKAASWQPIIYAIGQMMHISGLAYSGGYGVMRKTPGLELAGSIKFAMGFMGLGGLIAIIGGLMFVILAFKQIIGYKKGKVTL